jgi:hypothetical protein
MARRPALALLILSVTAAAVAQRPPTLGSDPFRVVETMRVQPPSADGVEVRVTDRTGAPLAGVNVVVLSTAELNTDPGRQTTGHPALARFRTDLPLRMFAVATALGGRYVTDEQGTTRVKVEGSAHVFVAHRRALESLVVTERARERGIDVALEPPPSIEVLVHDSRGRPVEGVPLLVVDSSQQRIWRVTDPPIETDREGRARVPLPESEGPRDVLAALASRRVLRAQLDPARERIELELPPCGQLRVYAPAEELDGHRLTSGRLRLRHLDSQAPGLHQFEAEEIGEDFVTFRWVGVDEPVDVSLGIDGSFGAAALEITGPSLPDEMKVVRFEGLTPALERSCRLLGLDGEPVGSETLLFVIARPGRTARRTIDTDEEGQTAFRIEPAEIHEDAVITLVRRGVKNEPAGAIRWTIPELQAIGAESLGDRSLGEEPLLIAGRIRDDAGRPVAGVTVRTEADYAIPSTGGRSSSSTGSAYRFREHAATTDESGRFVLRELNPLRSGVTLDVDTPPTSRVDGPLHFLVGEDDVDLVVVPAGALRGAFAPFPEDTPFGGSLQLVALDGLTHDVDLDRSDGTFEAGGLPPGDYTLEILVARSDEPARRIRGVEIRAGEVREDPRLARIDWTEFLRPAVLRLTDPDGRPFRANVRRLIRQERGITTEGIRGSRDGQSFVVWVADSGAEILVQDPDHRTVHIEKLERDRTMTLEPRPRLRLQFRNLPNLPPWMSLRYRLEPLESELPQPLAHLFRDTGPVTGQPQLVRPDLEGRARLRLEVQVTADVMRTIRAAGGRIRAQIVREIEVADRAEEQELAVELTEEEAADLERIAADIQELLDR